MTPFEKGKVAAKAGQDSSANPFLTGTPQFAEWQAGFHSMGGGTCRCEGRHQEGEGI